MGDEHARFEELAVGHVLGGLPSDDADEFRGHLIDCRECRLRVAELRDIANDLAAAEREERQRVRTKTEVARRTEPEDEVDPDDRSWPLPVPSARTIAVGGVLLLGALVALATWSLHLRTVNAELLAVSSRQEVVMEAFADGTTVATSFVGTTSGRVAITDEVVALTLVDVPQPAADRRLVIWLVTDEDAQPVYVGLRTNDGRLAWAAPHRGADRLIVSVERWSPELSLDAPEGTVIVEADLTAPQVESVPDGTQPRASFVAR